MARPWTYVLQPEVEERIRNLLSDRCGITLDAHLHGHYIHLTTLLRAIHNIWHTVWDEAPIKPCDSEMLRTQEQTLLNQGDAIIRGFLEGGGLLREEHIIYVLARNIRTKVQVMGLERGDWVFFSFTNNQSGIQFMYQPAGNGEHAVLAEKVPWRGVAQYLANLHFELDHGERGQFGTFEEQLGLEPSEQVVTQNFLTLGHPDVFRSLREI